MSQEKNIWEPMEGETKTAYNWFIQFANMPPTERSLRTLARQHNRSETSFSRWSQLYKWHDRALQWDAQKHITTMTLVEQTHVGYQQQVVEDLLEDLAASRKVIRMTLKEMIQQAASGNAPEAKDIKSVVSSLKTLDDLARRAGGMPTNFTSEGASEPDYGDMVFVVGED